MAHVKYNGDPQAPTPKFQFLNATEFFKALKTHRSVFLTGPQGEGKTSLGTMIAIELRKHGAVSHIWANFTMRYADRIQPPILDGVSVMDETHQFLDARNFQSNNTSGYFAYSRKRNLYMVMPSVFDVDKRLRGLCIRRTYPLKNLIWFYRWWEGEEDSQEKPRRLAIWKPQEVFSCYDTLAETGMQPDGGYADALTISIEWDKRQHDHWNGRDFYAPWFNMKTGKYEPMTSPYRPLELETWREENGLTKKKGKNNFDQLDMASEELSELQAS